MWHVESNRREERPIDSIYMYKCTCLFGHVSICLIFLQSWILMEHFYNWCLFVDWQLFEKWQVGEKQLPEKQPSCCATYLECSKPIEEWKLPLASKHLLWLYPVVPARPHEYIDMDGFLAPCLQFFSYKKTPQKSEVFFFHLRWIDFLRLWFQRINLWKVLRCAWTTNFQIGWTKWKS